ncbi:MAG: cyclic nucleotide-binding domain-containing protein [Kiloniellales bacterium]|nr:cyclic nucleotide-binding domain-containing protein [Kiloniellales bacterium]
MGLAQEVEILRRIPLFANIDPAKLKLMCFASERVTFKDGEVLCRQGETGDSAFIILDGTADVQVKRKEGTMSVATLTKNDIVGEIAILCDVPRTATVLAKGELTTLKVTKELFFGLVKDFPEIGIEIMRVLAHRLEATTGELIAAKAGA